MRQTPPSIWFWGSFLCLAGVTGLRFHQSLLQTSQLPHARLDLTIYCFRLPLPGCRAGNIGSKNESTKTLWFMETQLEL